MSDSLFVCVKLHSLDFKSMFCLLFAYLVYITIILFWNHIEHLPLAHLKGLPEPIKTAKFKNSV